jgi:hypothetical protein
VPEATKQLTDAVNSLFEEDSPESEKCFLRTERLFLQDPL